MNWESMIAGFCGAVIGFCVGLIAPTIQDATARAEECQPKVLVCQHQFSEDFNQLVLVCEEAKIQEEEEK